MTKNFTLFSILLLLPLCLCAQKDNGFILTMKQDTLYGKVRINNKLDGISFQYEGKKVELHASSITYFGVKKKGTTRIYKTLINNWEEYIFVEVLTEGKFNLYHYDTAGNDRYTRSDPYRYYIGSSNIYPIRMSPRSYRSMMKMMVRIVEEEPELLGQLADYEDVPRIIRKYNAF